MLSLNQLMIFILLLIIVEAEYYTKENTTAIFDFYKKKYHKKYINNEDEEEAFKNFVNNLNTVTALNENPKEKNIIYSLNKYADIDPEDLEERFALNVTVYDANTLHKGPSISDGHILNNKHEPQPEGENLESIELYDLDDAENLYKRYMETYGKKNFSKKYDQTVHYYRFVKTLVDLNREHYLGKRDKTLNDKADVVERPYDYYY